MKDFFRIFSVKVSAIAGSAYVFLFALLIILLWASTGPLFNFSDTWQLIINTGTTIVTFLMVFLIQNTQNRDSKAMQLKLDELIHANKSARNSFVGLEDLTDGELLELDGEFKKLRDQLPENKAVQKLHKKIEQEHAYRLNFRDHAHNMIGSILNPLNTLSGGIVSGRDGKDDKNKKGSK